MCSLPYSLLIKADSDVLPQSIIQEHQNFCKLFLKYKSSYEKKKDENKHLKDSASSSSEKSKEVQIQLKIWNWFENLPFEQKIKICTIKNKWLVKIIIQLFFIYYIDNKSTFSPIDDMALLFTNQKNYQNIGGIGGMLYKNIQIISNFNEKKNYLGYNEDDYCKLYFNLKERDFSQITKDQDVEKKELEKKLLDNIILLSLDDESLDTISINVDLLKDIKYFKKLLYYFSGKECFKDWLEPFNCNNYYNFSYPQWMHNNSKLSLCSILIGIYEQQILLSYEYFIYSKKMYELPWGNSILNKYQDNKNLEKFIEDNYYYEGKMNTNTKTNINIIMDKNKENILTLNIIIDVVNKIKTESNNKRKYDNFKKMLDQLFNDYNKSQFYNGNKILSESTQSVFKELIIEMGKEKGKAIKLLLNKITFMKLEDVINYREFIYIFLRNHFSDLRSKKFINDLLNEDENKSLRKKKKKKKNKNKGVNTLNIILNEDILNNNEIREKENYIIQGNMNINNNKFENIDINSSSINNIYNNKIIKKSKQNEDTSIIVKSLENKEIENTNLKNKNGNNIEENIKETQNKNRNFFLFPLNNKKRKNKNKIISKENKKEIIIKEKSSEDDKILKKLEKEENNIDIKINEEKNKEKKIKLEDENKKIINNEENESKNKNTNNKNIKLNNNISKIEPKKENINKNEVIKPKNKYELSKISAISLQMLNETKNKNDSIEKIISIEKQKEINKFYTKPETTTSFSYEATSKIEN